MRPWCVPPALRHEADELLEGSQILYELSGALSLVLWQSLRDVILWAGVPADRREGLFAEHAAQRRMNDLLAAGIDAALQIALTTLAAVVAAPAAANPVIVTEVCLRISQWAEARGAIATAMEYAQAAALASPEHPRPALATGVLAQRSERTARAETWLRRCIGLSRRARDWKTYSEGCVALGDLYVRRAERDPARRYLLNGMRAARRAGMPEVRGAALHGLLLLDLEHGPTAETVRYGRAAVRAYGQDHPRMPALLHDLATVWVRIGDYESASRTLQRLLPSRHAAVERALTLSLLAHAAAGLGRRRAYRQFWTEARRLITHEPGRESLHSAAALELVRAATLVSDWPRVEMALQLQQASILPE